MLNLIPMVRLQLHAVLGLAVLGLSTSAAQSTNGVISGRVVRVADLTPLERVTVTAAHTLLPLTLRSLTGPQGFYTLPLTPPGVYRLRVEANGFQPAELQEVELAVAGLAEVNFELRPLSGVWEPGQTSQIYLRNRYLVDFYGPDIALLSRYLNPDQTGSGTLEATVSRVINPRHLRALPFLGRDLYTMLVTAPGLSADAATARGLGLSVNGQRSSSSNFLLDGVETNNLLVSGPLLAVAPEAVEEYRISTNNWAAEFGGASGVIANAITRRGGTSWHGLLYAYGKNEALNANDFQDNIAGWRRPQKEFQPGFQLGGPLGSPRVTLSSSLELLRSRSNQQPVTFQLPSASFVSLYTAPGSAARTLLERYPSPAPADGLRPTATWTAAPPVTIDRTLSLHRVDLDRGGHRFMARLAVAALDRPDFIWTPYRDFVSALDQPALTMAGGLTSALAPSLSNEVRVSWSRSRIRWNRPHPEVPTLSTIEGVLLPGSPAFYEFDNRNTQWELVENLVWTRRRHIAKLGGAALWRGVDNLLTAGRDGHYRFGTVIDFAIGRPRTFQTTVARAVPDLRQPDFDRSRRMRQTAWFLQDAFRVTPRFTLNAGLRSERFGTPSAEGEMLLRLGTTGSPADRLRAASLVPGAHQTVYASCWNWAPRAGFSLDLGGRWSAVLRGAAGRYHDRPFDNLWSSVRNNGFVLRTFPFRGRDDSFLTPVSQVLPAYAAERSTGDEFPDLLAMETSISAPVATNSFLSLQGRPSAGWSFEATVNRSQGRRLWVTDQINRPFSVPVSEGGNSNPDRVYNPALPLVSHRTQQGRSSHHALTLSTAYASRSAQFHAAYTWAHTIDDQSDPLAGDFFDVDFTRIRPAAQRRVAAFSRQFDQNADRGNADFDQRHNFVFYSILTAPAWKSRAGWLLQGWQLSQIAGFRSGFPFTVQAASTVPESGGSVFNNRANVIDPRSVYLRSPEPVPGGRRILNAAAFAEPASGTLGNLGRNALRAPGFFNVDVSVSRRFGLARLKESAALLIRADVFNVLNHANLDTPNATLGSPGFGSAVFGRRGGVSGFPALFPFQETGRQVQVMLQLVF